MVLSRLVPRPWHLGTMLSVVLVLLGTCARSSAGRSLLYYQKAPGRLSPDPGATVRQLLLPGLAEARWVRADGKVYYSDPSNIDFTTLGEDRLGAAFPFPVDMISNGHSFPTSPSHSLHHVPSLVDDRGVVVFSATKMSFYANDGLLGEHEDSQLERLLAAVQAEQQAVSVLFGKADENIYFGLIDHATSPPILLSTLGSSEPEFRASLGLGPVFHVVNNQAYFRVDALTGEVQRDSLSDVDRILQVLPTRLVSTDPDSQDVVFLLNSGSICICIDWQPSGNCPSQGASITIALTDVGASTSGELLNPPPQALAQGLSYLLYHDPGTSAVWRFDLHPDGTHITKHQEIVLAGMSGFPSVGNLRLLAFRHTGSAEDWVLSDGEFVHFDPNAFRCQEDPSIVCDDESRSSAQGWSCAEGRVLAPFDSQGHLCGGCDDEWTKTRRDPFDDGYRLHVDTDNGDTSCLADCPSDWPGSGGDLCTPPAMGRLSLAWGGMDFLEQPHAGALASLASVAASHLVWSPSLEKLMLEFPLPSANTLLGFDHDSQVVELTRATDGNFLRSQAIPFPLGAPSIVWSMMELALPLDETAWPALGMASFQSKGDMDWPGCHLRRLSRTHISVEAGPTSSPGAVISFDASGTPLVVRQPDTHRHAALFAGVPGAGDQLLSVGGHVSRILPLALGADDVRRIALPAAVAADPQGSHGWYGISVADFSNDRTIETFLNDLVPDGESILWRVLHLPLGGLPHGRVAEVPGNTQTLAQLPRAWDSATLEPAFLTVGPLSEEFPVILLMVMPGGLAAAPLRCNPAANHLCWLRQASFHAFPGGVQVVPAEVTVAQVHGPAAVGTLAGEEPSITIVFQVATGPAWTMDIRLAACPDGTHGPECVLCDESCELCDGPGPSRCTACKLQLPDGECVASCPPGMEEDDNKTCTCPPTCVSCVRLASQRYECQQCQDKLHHLRG
ncbi:hypothetical protein H696_05062 [Fonticula alba]|uniref:Uncharacterized protein n=1 Tax=Fonticula alba TaxID=691883 RepID=A0A058Z3Q0_FONAL|nr:hypothetical protein H696_05062 [Fonticula alba]KCV68766.1 hypothetical protein H696_05062 [Fonticula alba]|eukprot:XP_009497198.1 hypothetical protein H696_05062 [Fonticula alba]